MSYPGPKTDSFMQRLLRPGLAAVTDVVFPPLCVVCKAVLESGAPRHELKAWFCEVCAAQVEYVEPPYCARCGEMFDGSFSNAFRCYNCEDRRLDFDFAIAACPARDVVRELIHSFKYGGRLHLRGVLATLMLHTLKETRLVGEDLSSWLLVPVPLHASREADREYNQSWELCQRLAEMTGIHAAKVLQRVRATHAQARLNREERQRNLRGAFRLAPARLWQRPVAVKGRSILLLDDVFTTGATTSECARVLRQEGGAEKVVVITVARG